MCADDTSGPWLWDLERVDTWLVTPLSSGQAAVYPRARGGGVSVLTKPELATKVGLNSWRLANHGGRL